MKRLAMDFEKSPVDGLPSYLSMLSGRAGQSNMMPRWWLAPNYEPIRRDADGLAWELRGTGVKCMTEEDVMHADGSIQHTGKSSTVAQKWADNFTERFEELAREDSTFGQLRNVMDLAVVAALLSKEGLTQFAGLEMLQLTGGTELEQYPAPRLGRFASEPGEEGPQLDHQRLRRRANLPVAGGRPHGSFGRAGVGAAGAKRRIARLGIGSGLAVSVPGRCSRRLKDAG